MGKQQGWGTSQRNPSRKQRCQLTRKKRSHYLKIMGLTFPNGKYFPSLTAQESSDFVISPSVGFQLRQPITPVALWLPLAFPATVRMPKAAVNENCQLSPVEYDVWFARKARAPEAVSTITECP
jgi:hypothetical protein